MAALYNLQKLSKNETRLFALVRREFDAPQAKRFDPQEEARLEAYGRAFDKLGIGFSRGYCCGWYDPAPVLTLWTMLRAMSNPLSLSYFFYEEEEFRDICEPIGRPRFNLQFEAHGYGLSLDAYLFTDSAFESTMDQRGKDIQQVITKLVTEAENSDPEEEAIIFCTDSCSLTLGLLAFFKNDAQQRKDAVKGIHNHHNSNLPPVRLINDSELAVELVFLTKKRFPVLTAINYLGDYNFVPIGKAAKP